VAVAWNTAAARRLGGHGWAMAIGNGLAAMQAGFLIDSAMSVLSMYVTSRVA
jgi:hypothetical protein